MGFWSALADIGLGIAAPFTGGASLAGIPMVNALANGSNTASDVGQVAAGDAAGAAQGRAQQAQIQNNYDRNAIDLYRSQLLGQQQGVNQRSQLARQAAAGDLLNNLQDVQISGLPAGVHMANITGGLRPSALGTTAKQGASTEARQALLQLMSGNPMPQAPSLSPMPTPSLYNDITQGIGRAGAYAGALSPLFSGMQAPGIPQYGGTAADVIGGVDPNADLYSGNNWDWLANAGSQTYGG